MTSVFDLLALPSVALNSVLAKMDLNSIINLAISSKSCEKTVKWCNLSRKPIKFQLIYFSIRSQLIISFKNGPTLLVCIGNSELLAEDNSNRRTLKSNTFLEDYMGECEYHTYWKDVPCATKLFVEFLTDLFKISIDSISINTPTGISNEEIDSFLNWISSTQNFCVSTCKSSGRNVEVDGEYGEMDNDGEKLMRIIKTNKNIQSFDLEVDFSNTLYIPITIAWARWPTLQHVLEMKCVQLNVIESEFTSEDVNKILKMWKKGWNHSMKFISILNETNFQNLTILHQLNAVAVDERGTYQIERQTDGAIARIYTDTYGVTISVELNDSEPPTKRMRI